jgi:hypothetical protein
VPVWPPWARSGRERNGRFRVNNSDKQTLVHRASRLPRAKFEPMQTFVADLAMLPRLRETCCDGFREIGLCGINF